MPEVSIIIPAYNAEACLGQAVDSVLAQRFADWELILVDDGSRDDTPGLCDGYAAADSRIRVLHKKNGGVSAARNDGMDAARGKWIAFLDADDRYDPDYLSSLLEAVAHTGADSTACGFYYSYPDGRRLPAPAPMEAGFHDPGTVVSGFVLPLLNDRVSAKLTLGTIWRCLFKTEVLRRGGLRFSGAYLEDELFLIEYYAQGQSLVCVDAPLYDYYQNPASVTHRYLADYVDTFTRTLEAKAALVERFSLPAGPGWRDNSAWAGLLIAAANLFAPGAPGGILSRARELRRLCALPVFSRAHRCYVPRNMHRNKAVVAALLRRGLYLPLSLLYTVKNRNR